MSRGSYLIYFVPMARDSAFKAAYQKLNPAQRQAVDTIEGPVMVIAGPGTGKTQVLSLRIANILDRTDTTADSILCLTFTNSGVRAMRSRLRELIGAEASKVRISTFHAFAAYCIEKYYLDLGFLTMPSLIADDQAILLCDELLTTHEWTHIRSRTNPALYFRDLTGLVQLLKRERITPHAFRVEIDADIQRLQDDPDSISSRGASKGQLKQEIVKKIEGLERTRETVRFYELYEETKRDRGLMDYQDVLEYLVQIVETSESARADIRESYLYVHVDEHQDSSGIQNEFLERVWGDAETQNLFVVGDDRQLIYGFGGASLSHFESFLRTFKKVELITLLENYRSTQTILDVADQMLASSLAQGTLRGNRPGNFPVVLRQYQYPRDEIIGAAHSIKKAIQSGTEASDIAVLVPKNYHVRTAVQTLRDAGIPVSESSGSSFFGLRETQSLVAILRMLDRPMDPSLVGPVLLDPLSRVPVLAAHSYIAKADTRKLTFTNVLQDFKENLFAQSDPMYAWVRQLSEWLEVSHGGDLCGLVQRIGNELLIKTATDHDTLARRVEVIRTMIHLVISQAEKNPRVTLGEFLDFLDRLEEYGHEVPLAAFGTQDGVRVMTMHASKGLEFGHVWIAHVNEKALQGKSGSAFTLPESIKEKIEERDEAVTRRQLYVAITRAKDQCVLSYSTTGYTGGEMELSPILEEMHGAFLFKSVTENQSELAEYGIESLVVSSVQPETPKTREDIQGLVAEEYEKRNVSATMLNNFYECPWKWYFRNILQLPEPGSVSLQLGTVVHATIERLVKMVKVPSVEDVEETVIEESGKLRGIDDTALERLRRDASAIATRWMNERLPNIRRPIESERALSYHDPEFGHLVVTGKIDLVEYLSRDDGKQYVRVTDFKTGKPQKTIDIEREADEGRLSNYLRQLAMYSYLIHATTRGDKIVAESLLEFLEAPAGDKNGIYTTVIHEEQVQALRTDIKDYDAAVSGGTWMDRGCGFKPWKTGEGCPYCAMARQVGL